MIYFNFKDIDFFFYINKHIYLKCTNRLKIYQIFKEMILECIYKFSKRERLIM